MIERQPPDCQVQVQDFSENALFGPGNFLGMAEFGNTTCDAQQAWNSTTEAPQIQLGSTSTSSQDSQLSCYGILNTTCDPPMSFRDRHRFLDGVYNSYTDPASITAEDMFDIARKVGLLMEEVLSWFKDEKSRRAKLVADNLHQSQKSTCQLPPSPISVRSSVEVSSASSPYDGTSREVFPKLQDTLAPFSASADQNAPTPLKAKRGRPAKTHVKIENASPSPSAKRKKISVKYPCPDCRSIFPLERWAEHINRKHFPKHVWECPKINRQTGDSCSSSPHYRPAYRDDNFATHLKGEHNCSDAEVVELKKTCKFKVTNFFHKICGFCDKHLKSRDESLEHIKDHFRRASEEINPPVDLGVTLWKEKCGAEHHLQVGIHYRDSQRSKRESTAENDNNGHDEHENGGSGGGSPDNSSHGNSGFRSSNNHGYDVSGSGKSGGRIPETPYQGSPGSQQDKNSQIYEHNESSRLKTCQYDIWNRDSRSLDFHTGSSIPAVPSFSSGPQHSSHGHNFPLPEWAPQGLGLDPNIVSWDNFASLSDPCILHPQYTGRPASVAPSNDAYQPLAYPCSPALSQMSRSPRPIKQGSQPGIESSFSPSGMKEFDFGHSAWKQDAFFVPSILPPPLYPYPPPRRPSLASHQSCSNIDVIEDAYREKGRCTYPECGKVFKDLKAHMLTHQNDRPEKCPIQTCDYHIKGFARKYDKNRHTLTHYKGTVVCPFCPSSVEKSFNRADIFKRHLTGVHGVEQTPPNSRKKTSGNINSAKRLSGYAPDASGKCSTCSRIFSNAQDFYEHLDDCVLRIVQQEDPSEAVNAARLAEIAASAANRSGEDENDADDAKAQQNDPGSSRIGELKLSEKSVMLNPKGQRGDNENPSFRVCASPTMEPQKGVPLDLEQLRQPTKDDAACDTEGGTKLHGEETKSSVTDVNGQTILGLEEVTHESPEEENSPRTVENDLVSTDLEDPTEVEG